MFNGDSEESHKGGCDMKCDRCGKEFRPGNRTNGLPNGLEFLMADGRSVIVCTGCLLEFAKKGIKEFFGREFDGNKNK